MLETKTYTSYVGDPIGLPSKEQLEAEYPSTKYTIVSGMRDTDPIYQTDSNNNQFKLYLGHVFKEEVREKDVHVTTEFLDYETNAVLHAPITQTAHFERTCKVDQVNGNFVWGPEPDPFQLKGIDLSSLGIYEQGYRPKPWKISSNLIVHYDDLDDTQSVVEYFAKGYVATINFYDDSVDPSKNVFSIHYKHRLLHDTYDEDVTRTIHLIDQINQKEIADPIQQIVHFSLPGVYGYHAKEWTWDWDHFNDTSSWKALSAKEIKDYLATQNNDRYILLSDPVPAQTVVYDENDTDQTVDLYFVPAYQAILRWVDETTGKTLETWTSKEGKANDSIVFDENVQQTLDHYQTLYYDLVSNPIKEGLVLNDDPTLNGYAIYLKHQIKTERVSNTVKVPIDLLAGDPNDKTTWKLLHHDEWSHTFYRPQYTDFVTGVITFGVYEDPKEVMFEYTFPTFEGYMKPDPAQFSPMKVTCDDETGFLSIQQFYIRIKEAVLNFIDDDQDGKIVWSQKATIAEHKPIEFVYRDYYKKWFSDHGMKVVSDNYEKRIINMDDPAKNIFEIHLEHVKSPTTFTKKVTRTIHFIDQANQNVLKDPVEQTVTFILQGTKDEWSQETTWDWDHFSNIQEWSAYQALVAKNNTSREGHQTEIPAYTKKATSSSEPTAVHTGIFQSLVGMAASLFGISLFKKHKKE